MADELNNAGPDGQTFDGGTSTDPQTGAPADGSTSTPSAAADPNAAPNAAVNPASTGNANGQPAKNWEVEFKRVNDSYNELRQKLQTQGQEKNEYKKRFDSLENTLRQLGEQFGSFMDAKNYDPDQFMEDLRTQGPGYFKSLLEKERERLLADTNRQVGELSQTVSTLQTERLVGHMKADQETYPDFAALENDMAEIYKKNAALFDSQYPDMAEKLDALYNAARLQRSPDALKQAEALGRKKTEEELAREAHAAGAGGGNAGAVTALDPKSMSAEQMREHLVKQGLYSDD